MAPATQQSQTSTARSKRKQRAVRRVDLDALKLGKQCKKCKAVCSREPGGVHPAAMHWHHVRGEKSFKVADAVGMMIPIDVVKREIKLCELWCANCHLTHHAVEREKNGLAPVSG